MLLRASVTLWRMLLFDMAYSYSELLPTAFHERYIKMHVGFVVISIARFSAYIPPRYFY